MRFRKIAIVLLSVALLAAKKKKPEMTQVLELPKDPPMAATGDSTRLVFNLSPLTGKGLLSAQTREALKAILKANGGAPVIHLRAFVSGSGDLRRVPQIVSEVFTDKHMPLPSVSVVQVGALPLEGAQIVIEAVSEAKKPVSATGLAFTVGHESAERALAVTCFVSDLAASTGLAERFPGAVVDIVQPQRIPTGPMTSCQVITRAGNPSRLTFSGTRIAFGAAQKDAALAFQRLDNDLADAGVLSTNIYAASEPAGELAKKLRPNSGALAVIPVEGVASIDGSFAADAIAVAK